MKKIYSFTLVTLLFSAMANADNTTNAPVKPYPLDRCIICGMSVKGADAFTFVYHGQEIKLCDQSEKKEFERNPKKYLKKMAKEAAKQTNSVNK